ncbi:hypothetical protein C8R45DRAFT_944839 [Mycena sanguinolenta]|nr:hypothetical protein C8R45DRAFT_944839 [Mycena sanguinolenta]
MAPHDSDINQLDSDGDDNLADNDVDGIIQQMVDQNPVPQVMKEKEKKEKGKKKQLEKRKREKENEDSNDAAGPSKRKKAKSKAKEDKVNDDDDEPLVQLTGNDFEQSCEAYLRLQESSLHERRVNRPFLPLGGTVGFGTLKTQTSASRDKIVIVKMPGAEAGSSKAAEFDYSELEAVSTEESVVQQKVGFDKAIEPHIEQLKEHWPENDAGKRIYTDGKGFQWELTPIHLSIWGAHMACGSATLHKPPLSTQFDTKYRLKSSAAAVPLVQPYAPPPAQIVVPNQGVGVQLTADKLLELMATSTLLQHQQPLHASFTVVPAPPVVLPPIPAPPANPSPLEYEPGNKGIVGLGREDWHVHAGFSKLAWDKMLEVHKQFCKDVRDSLWA